MSALKNALVGGAVIAVAVAALLGTGVIGLSSGGPDSASATATVSDAPGGGGGTKKDSSLDDLGYLGVAAFPADEKKKGLTLYKRDATQPGLVLFNYCGWGPGLKKAGLDRPWAKTVLMNLEGDVLHEWESLMFGRVKEGRSQSRLMPDGSLVLNVTDKGLAKVDWDGNVLWKLDGMYHHDVNYDDQGRVYGLFERRIEVDSASGPKPIRDHAIAIISPDGVVLETLWFSEIFAEFPPYLERLEKGVLKKGQDHADVFHANSVEILRAHPDGLWETGDILTSLRNTNSVAVISRRTKEVLWTWGVGDLQRQHSPSMTAAGHVVIFDNGKKRKWSSVVVVDAKANQIVFKYRGTKGRPFFSATRGVVDALPGGNVFVVSSNQGRMFELSPEGGIVWEYFTPESFGDKREPIRGMRIHGPLFEAISKRLNDGTQQPAGAAEPEDTAESTAEAGAAPDAAEPVDADTAAAVDTP